MHFFIVSLKKHPFFTTCTRNFRSFSEKHPYFSPKPPKIRFFVFLKNQGYKDQFSTILHQFSTAGTLSAPGRPEMRRAATSGKNPPHCYFRNNFLLQFGN